MENKAELKKRLSDLLDSCDGEECIDAVFVIFLTDEHGNTGPVWSSTLNGDFLVEAALRHTADREKHLAKKQLRWR